MISNVTITIHGVRGSTNAAIAWHANGFRYHFWANLDNEIEAEGNILYKNSIKYDSNVRTMKLRADALANKAMIDKVLAHVAENDMVAVARAEWRAKLEAEEKERKDALAAHIEERLAVDFFAELVKRVRDAGMNHLLIDIDAARKAKRVEAGL